MAHHVTITGLMRTQAKRFQLAQQSMAKAVKADADAGHALFVAEVSGNVSSRQLRALGYPFGRTGGLQRTFLKSKAKSIGVKGVRSAGRKSPRGFLPGLPINVQTGKLRSEVREWKADADSYLLGSTTPYAKYVLSWAGTAKMIARTRNGRPLIGGKNKGGKTMGLLEQHQRMRNKARELALRKAHRSI